MIIDVSATEKEGSFVQSYPTMTALRGFEIINVMDKTQVFQIFRLAATNSHHLPQCELSTVVFLIIAMIFDIWLVRKHELSFCPLKHFLWLHAFYLDPFFCRK
jgi:hypothetical protein